MYRVPKLLAVLALAAGLAASGCKESPTAPESSAPPTTPPPTVKTPVSMTIQSITILKFPAKKTDGSDWDLSLIAADRRPDLYVVLNADNVAADYTSGVISNAAQGNTYVFDSVTSGLRASLPFDSSRRLYVMDDDIGSADDRLGWVTVNLPAAYNDDGATAMGYTYTDSGGRLSVWIRGTWNY